MISTISVSSRADGSESNAGSPIETGSGGAPTKTADNAVRGSSKTSSNSSSREGTPIPEPSNLVMLALGIAGLVAGRYAAKKHRGKP
ncbi:PEP-CTERM sorting domain-containing protein [Parasphingorhabdus sp.]